MKKLITLFLKLSNKNQHRVIFFLTLILISLSFITMMHFHEKKESTKKIQTVATKKIPRNITTQEIDEMIQRIESDKATSVKKEDVKAYIQRFNNVRDTINKYKTISNAELQQKISELEKSQTKYQQKYFPLMRKTFANDLKEMLWRENIEVNISGKNNEILNLTGGKFANNANKEDFTKSIEQHLVNLRFKRIYYKWFKYDEDGVYYEFNSKDSEL